MTERDGYDPACSIKKTLFRFDSMESRNDNDKSVSENVYDPYDHTPKPNYPTTNQFQNGTDSTNENENKFRSRSSRKNQGFFSKIELGDRGRAELELELELEQDQDHQENDGWCTDHITDTSIHVHTKHDDRNRNINLNMNHRMLLSPTSPSRPSPNVLFPTMTSATPSKLSAYNSSSPSEVNMNMNMDDDDDGDDDDDDTFVTEADDVYADVDADVSVDVGGGGANSNDVMPMIMPSTSSSTSSSSPPRCQSPTTTRARQSTSINTITGTSRTRTGYMRTNTPPRRKISIGTATTSSFGTGTGAGISTGTSISTTSGMSASTPASHSRKRSSSEIQKRHKQSASTGTSTTKSTSISATASTSTSANVHVHVPPTPAVKKVSASASASTSSTTGVGTGSLKQQLFSETSWLSKGGDSGDTHHHPTAAITATTPFTTSTSTSTSTPFTPYQPQKQQPSSLFTGSPIAEEEGKKDEDGDGDEDETNTDVDIDTDVDTVVDSDGDIDVEGDGEDEDEGAATDLDSSMEMDNVSKIRRLNLDEDVTMNMNMNMNGHGNTNTNMNMNMKRNMDMAIKHSKEISPTDVMNGAKIIGGAAGGGLGAGGGFKGGVLGSDISPAGTFFYPRHYQHQNHAESLSEIIGSMNDHDHDGVGVGGGFCSPPALMSNRKELGGFGNGNSNSTGNGRSTPVMMGPPSPRRMRREHQHQYRRDHHSHIHVPETPMLARKGPRSRIMNLDLDSGNEYHNHHQEKGMRRENHITTASTSSSTPKSRFNEDFEIIRTIGNGSFGTVYKCRSRLDGCLYAVKAAKQRARGTTDRERMLKEVTALAELSDTREIGAFHILRYHQAWMEDQNRLHIVTELCTSTLQDEMWNGTFKGVQGVNRQYILLREMLLALRLIHQHKLVHLDIKPENIFVKDGRFLLGDFGLVNKATVRGEVEEGDCRYMCLDLWSGNHRDLTKCDIFSLGITIYEIVINKSLPSDGQEWQDLRAGKLAPMAGAPLALQQIIQQMMYPNGSERPTAAELLKHRQLLSDEEKELIVEKNKVKQANMALAHQQAQMKSLTPPKRLLTRSYTCPR